MPGHGLSAANANTAPRLAEAFARHGVTAAFGHSWAELGTLRRLKAPVTTAVLNNGVLGFQKHGEDTVPGEHAVACDFADVDHAAIARACGIRAARVERGEDVGPALDAAFASDEPNLIEVITDPDAKPPLTFFHGHHPEPF